MFVFIPFQTNGQARPAADRSAVRLVARRWVSLAIAVALTGVAAPVRARDNAPTLDQLLHISPSQKAPEEAPAKHPSGTQKQKPTASSSADKDHRSKDVPASAPPAQPKKPTTSPANHNALPSDLRDLLDQPGASNGPAGLLKSALRQMDGVSQRLGQQLDPGVRTQRQQKAILAKLDRVIAAARRRKSSNGSGGSSSQSSRAQQQESGGKQLAQQNLSSRRGGAPTSARTAANPQGRQGTRGQAVLDRPEPKSMKELRHEWGNLPPRLRNELSQGLTEPFSPVYRDLTEQYYRRIAEEK